jgi:hypothetical protein
VRALWVGFLHLVRAWRLGELRRLGGRVVANYVATVYRADRWANYRGSSIFIFMTAASVVLCCLTRPDSPARKVEASRTSLRLDQTSKLLRRVPFFRSDNHMGHGTVFLVRCERFDTVNRPSLSEGKGERASDGISEKCWRYRAGSIYPPAT